MVRSEKNKNTECGYRTVKRLGRIVRGHEVENDHYKAKDSASLGTSAEGLWTSRSIEGFPLFDVGELTTSSGRTGGSLDITCRRSSSPASPVYADEARGTSMEGLGVAAIVPGLDAVGARFAPGPTMIVAEGGGSAKSHARGTIATGMILIYI